MIINLNANLIKWRSVSFRLSVPRIYRALKTGRAERLIRLAKPPLVVWSRRPTPHRWEYSRRCVAIAVGVFICSRFVCATFLYDLLLLFFARCDSPDLRSRHRWRREFCRCIPARRLHHSRWSHRPVVAVFPRPSPTTAVFAHAHDLALLCGRFRSAGIAHAITIVGRTPA